MASNKYLGNNIFSCIVLLFELASIHIVLAVLITFILIQTRVVHITEQDAIHIVTILLVTIVPTFVLSGMYAWQQYRLSKQWKNTFFPLLIGSFDPIFLYFLFAILGIKTTIQVWNLSQNIFKIFSEIFLKLLVSIRWRMQNEKSFM